MSNIKILDCTLRDGGYINDFDFGQKVISQVIEKLSSASIEIIECGFLISKADNKDCSLFPTVSALSTVIGKKNPETMYVAMIQFGHISNEEIEPYDGTSIDGIRVTFHQHEIEDAFILASQLMQKGYKVFIQPVGTATYSDKDLLDLIYRVNNLMPFSFYIVDTLGTMYKNDMLRLFYLIDHNLNKHISIGFHSHNNLQLSFSNAQELLLLNTPREIIIDSTVLGMGRGAGNLCTELITQYINQNLGHKYEILSVLEIIDEYINPIKAKFEWGYSVPYYLAAVNNCHPNYASYLLNKQTLNVKEISAILKKIETSIRKEFDKPYLEKLYIEFQNHNVNDEEAIKVISDLCQGKEILIVAPGKSIEKQAIELQSYISSNNPIVISVNFIPDFKIDALYISNLKRFKALEHLNEFALTTKIFCTSNVSTTSDNNLSVINYANYLLDEAVISDNAGLMLMNLIDRIGASKIMLAGFDGYSINKDENFFGKNLILNIEDERLLKMNQAIATKIAQMQKKIEINFLTESIYDK